MKKHTQLRSATNGFTLIELLVVMTIIATLLTLAVPRYFNSLDKSKESVLRQDLATMRDAIDKYAADKGKHPDSLETLVEEKYLRHIPIDPITDRNDTWLTNTPDGPQPDGISDVHSGAEGSGKNGLAYAEW
jgi:general secretion pathway protein G